MDPHKRTTTLIVEIPASIPKMSDTEKLTQIRIRVGDLLQNRLALLSNEAAAVSSDMEGLLLRLRAQGHHARIDDIRSARWYRTASELKLLQNIYGYICALTGSEEGTVQVIVSDDSCEIRDSDSGSEHSGDL